MPCYTTTTIELDAAKWNRDRAAQAIRDAGHEDRARLNTNGILIIAAPDQATSEKYRDQIRQAYTAATLQAAAKRFGWRTTQTTTTQLTLTR